ncbi:hypothetical protein FPSE_06113 [Fusarium pseudograminearum CS3096]|uniref:Uncharacterized protein n=1 Tax=Fusarium pseudograminearum (strain CS3096) TaxID=1028729 RepID=K3VH44_FUSPC|nr:hypothetical protein FPSE_06113 [Fusarium pseudograminearum CS3096]EKJ73707.1 hypothetical protein FPSE_06113 [Fusarium pseudograminearum CS3096]
MSDNARVMKPPKNMTELASISLPSLGISNEPASVGTVRGAT